MNAPSIAIIGAGPAGLSAAHLLNARGLARVTVFEAGERLGGKSFSAAHAGAVHELGTCYSTMSHRFTNGWMKRLGVRQKRLGKQLIDGRPFWEFVKREPGESLRSEALRYLREWFRFNRALRTRPDDPNVRAEAAMPLLEWLEERRFRRVRLMMLRSVTTMGYGFLNEVSAYQGLVWTTPGLIATGVLGQLKLPVGGWQRFWERLAEPLDVRLASPVCMLDRREDGVVVATPHGEERFDQVLVTTPIDELERMCRLTEDERVVAEAVRWGRFASTLCRVDDWYENVDVQSFSASLQPGAERGRLVSSRRSKLPSLKTKRSGVYVCYQYAGDHAPGELIDRLRADLSDLGATYRATIFQKIWKFFPRYEPAALGEGLLSRMRAMQGRERTWYSGATFSHEAVSNIVAFNHDLTARMAGALARRG
ncbi:MAG: FAD-dependent oxidoreductase [Caulobacterales bacterium]|nr:FAD-dependent oxidoreductase [Caulobacterales bacterium]